MANTENQSAGWDGYRSFVIEAKEPESATVTSFFLVPKDGKPLPSYKPGQFLGFKLDVSGLEKPVRRTYTISDSPNEGAHYRLSIKREPPPEGHPEMPPGVTSNHFHDHLNVGSELLVRAPSGDFFLQEDGSGPVVLLSGGVGLTPMISMLNHLVETGSKRPVWFIHGVRNGAEHAFGPHVRGLAQSHDNIDAHIVYMEPGPDDEKGRDYDGSGFITMELLQGLLPGPEGEFYLCGPPPFMKVLFNGLLGWGVAEERIFYEFFGPATVLKDESKDKPQPSAASKPGADAATGELAVTFQGSGVTVKWDPAKESILELAEANGLDPDFNCRSGVCHTCMCRLVEGEVEYIHDDVLIPDEEDQVLICSSRPKTNVTVDI